MTTSKFELVRNPFGRLVLTSAEGEVHEGVAPVRAFPVQAPDDGIALVSTDGKEVGWIDRIEDLPAAIGALVREELGGREFMPEISRINSVTSFATPCTWSVATDRGDTEFVLRGEEDIRRLTVDTLLISDIHGIHYLIRDVRELDKHSKKILDRFL
ncbi:DUF1854 domain-containing protein [Duganella sp. CT11-25]|jgi:hypothetical protein|uniref:cyanophycin metabolism-associated DUF1854 family protein n=1 Tax=unclassified Duganella TaxID=2636909 RepID=UPI0039B12186